MDYLKIFISILYVAGWGKHLSIADELVVVDLLTVEVISEIAKNIYTLYIQYLCIHIMILVVYLFSRFANPNCCCVYHIFI